MAPVRTGSAEFGAGGSGSGTKSLVYSLTIGAGNNQVLYVTLQSGLFRVMTSATFNSIPMTLINTYNPSSHIFMNIYRLINPPVGTYNISFSWILPMEASSIAVSYKDVEVTSPNLSAVLASGTASNPSATVTSDITSTILDFVMTSRNSAYSTVTADGGGQTRIQQITGLSPDGYGQDNVATEKAGAASTTMTHTLSSTGADVFWGQIAYSITPKSATTQNGFFF